MGSRAAFFFLLGILAVSVSAGVVARPLSVHAKKTIGDADASLTTVLGKSGIEKTDIPTVVGNVVQMALLFVGLIFFALSVYAGMRWLTSRGNEEYVTKARNTLIAAVVGLMIVVSAYAFTSLFTGRIIEGGSGVDAPPDSLGDGSQVTGCCLHIFKNDDGDDLTTSFPYWVIGGTGVSLLECEVIALSDAIKGTQGSEWEYYEGFDSDQCQEAFEAK